MENAYAVEWVEYYKKMGFDHIYIYDNNHIGEEHFEDVLSDYISDGFVTIFDWRDLTVAKLQKKAYNDFYSRYGKKYRWIAYYDFDEFLTIADGSDIHTFMNRYSNYDCLLINWMDYTDGDMVRNDGRPVLERLTVPMPFDKKVAYDFPENNHVKSIVRGGLQTCEFVSNPHVPSTKMRCCNTRNEKCGQYPWQPYDHSIAYIKHFTTKTIEEWLTNKWVKGAAGFTYERFLKIYKDFFFKINNRTKAKEAFIQRWKALQ